VKSNVLLYRLPSSKTNYPLKSLIMLLTLKGKIKTCKKFNVIATRNMDILLLVV